MADDLGVAAGDVQDDRVVRVRNDTAHLDVPDAVVDADDGLVPQQRQHAARHRARAQRRAEPGALGEADDVHVAPRDPAVFERRADERDDVRLVVPRHVARQEALGRRRDVRLAHVGDRVLVPELVQLDQPHTDLVGRALDAEGEHGGARVGAQ